MKNRFFLTIIIQLLLLNTIGYAQKAQKAKVKVIQEVNIISNTKVESNNTTNVSDSIKFPNLRIGIWRYNFKVGVYSWLALLPDQNIDSISINDSNYKIVEYVVEYPIYCGAMGDCVNSETIKGNKFPKDFKTKWMKHYSFQIKEITIQKKNIVYKLVDTHIIFIYERAKAFIYEHPSGRVYSGKDIKMSKAEFLGDSKLNIRIFAAEFFEHKKNETIKLESYTIEILSAIETKSFELKGDLLPTEVKNYILNTKGAISIHIKDVIGKDKDGKTRNVAGLIIECKN